MLQLGSEAFSQRSIASQGYPNVFTSSPRTVRSEQTRITGDVGAVLFDFDGTLTATPGDRSERKYKIAELKERGPLLQPWLRCLRDASMTIGIISKSSEDTIRTALAKSGLWELVNGPIVAKALGFEGKAGFIEELCRPGGALEHLGLDGARRVLLVDDDLLELQRAQEYHIQTYAAPVDGGLQYDDFHELFRLLELEQPARPADSKELRLIWSLGLAGESLGLSTEFSQVEYPEDRAPCFSDFYEVNESEVRLGQGAFGVCAPGVHIASGRPCAIKFMRKEVVGKHFLETFVENDLCSFLLKMDRHPNVVLHLDYLLGPTLMYCAMELLEGQDLDSYLQQHAPITESFAQRITHQVFRALQHIHVVNQIGLIHRDVKSENLRFRTEESGSDLVLVDFGLSCTALPAQKRGIVGTLLYMAPEMFTGRYSTQVDCWSVGVLLYIILAGRPPWQEELSAGVRPNKSVSDGSAVQQALEGEAVKDAPPRALDLLRALLVVDPAARLTATDAGKHEWLPDGTPGASLMLNVDKTTYVSVHEYTMQTPKAELGQVVSLNESDVSPNGAASPAGLSGQQMLPAFCVRTPTCQEDPGAAAVGVL